MSANGQESALARVLICGDVQAFSWDKHEKITRAELVSKIPPEFRQNVVFYDAEDIRAHYPGHGISERYSGYLPATW